MKRMNLFEFEDFHWFPSFLRDCLTNYIVAFHRLLGTPQEIAILLEKLPELKKNRKIVDLCSGAGGPMPEVLRILSEGSNEKIDLTLTDLYPNLAAADLFNNDVEGVDYCLEPVDAANLADDLLGVRTMIGSFHHMPQKVARTILKNCHDDKKSILIFELSDNSQPKYIWWIGLFVVPFMVLFITPFIRPLRAKQILFTYFLPILPFIIAWDGVVSNARTYSVGDLNELIADLNDDAYQWDIGLIRTARSPVAMLYLTGQPL